MTRCWGHFYAKAGGSDYYERHVSLHEPFLRAILDRRPRRVLEAGCGSGIMSVWLSKHGIECVALDRDQEVLKKAEINAQELGGKVRFVAADIFDTGLKTDEFDLVFSQGVWEHFGDEAIQRIVAEQTRLAPAVFSSVPSYYYRHRDFGDERLLTQGQWIQILKDCGRVKADYYDFERVKRNFFIKKPLMIMLLVETQ